MDTRDAGRLGGLARTANMTPEELRVATAKAGRSKWARMTPEQREDHMAKMSAAARRWREMRAAMAMDATGTVADGPDVADHPDPKEARDDATPNT